MIYEAVDPNANIIFGALVDESMEGEIAITVIATGFPLTGPQVSALRIALLMRRSPLSINNNTINTNLVAFRITLSQDGHYFLIHFSFFYKEPNSIKCMVLPPNMYYCGIVLCNDCGLLG